LETALRQKPRSLGRAYPKLWPAHFFFYAESILPQLSRRIKLRAGGISADPINTDAGFLIPEDDAHRRRFHATVLQYISGQSSGCPESLYETLSHGFQYLEENACERFREFRECLPEYDDDFVPPAVLSCYFTHCCTKNLGKVTQVIWYCKSRQQNVCRTLFYKLPFVLCLNLTPMHRYLCLPTACVWRDVAHRSLVEKSSSTPPVRI
jgi:hypothetical protein